MINDLTLDKCTMVTGFIGLVIQFLLISCYRQYKHLQICEVRARSCLLGFFFVITLRCFLMYCILIQAALQDDNNWNSHNQKEIWLVRAKDNFQWLIYKTL